MEWNQETKDPFSYWFYNNLWYCIMNIFFCILPLWVSLGLVWFLLQESGFKNKNTNIKHTCLNNTNATTTCLRSGLNWHLEVSAAFKNLSGRSHNLCWLLAHVSCLLAWKQARLTHVQCTIIDHFNNDIICRKTLISVSFVLNKLS